MTGRYNHYQGGRSTTRGGTQVRRRGADSPDVRILPPARQAARRADERGAVLVEAAFVLPVLIILMLGIFEFSLIFKDQQTIYSATRSGARIASAEARNTNYQTNTVDAVTTALAAIPQSNWRELWIYKASSSGMPPSGNFTTCSGACVKYVWTAGAWVKQSGSDWAATGTNSQYACSGNPDSLGVYLKIDHSMISGMFGNTKTLTDKTIIKLEPQPATSCQG